MAEAGFVALVFGASLKTNLVTLWHQDLQATSSAIMTQSACSETRVPAGQTRNPLPVP